MSHAITLFEMGPRDGLQNEKKLIPVAEKIQLINLLSECGFGKIEASSFVSPKWVPQMADAAEVFAGIERNPGVAYTALTPNMKGLESAISSRVDEVAIFAAASESFSQKNINCSIGESIERFKPLIETAKAANIPVRGYVSCVIDCPYEGEVSPQSVATVAKQLLDLGCYEVSLGDTTGKGNPQSVAAMLEAVLSVISPELLAGHYHDTSGHALNNIMVSLENGIRTFDSAVAGLGGCPYAPGAKGNVATGPVVNLLEGLGYTTGIDMEKLNQAEAFVQKILG